jgi:hypothetical protein
MEARFALAALNGYFVMRYQDAGPWAADLTVMKRDDV